MGQSVGSQGTGGVQKDDGEDSDGYVKHGFNKVELRRKGTPHPGVTKNRASRDPQARPKRPKESRRYVLGESAPDPLGGPLHLRADPDGGRGTRNLEDTRFLQRRPPGT